MNAKAGVGGGLERAVLAFALVYPALLTLVYFVWLVGAPEIVQQMGTAARRRVVENFTWDHFRTRLLDAYETAMRMVR